MSVMSREDRRAETRTRLLQAGRETFLEHGYHAASLAQVAARAGYTKGAVYANFATKADLFLAIVDERGSSRAAAFTAAADAADGFAGLSEAVNEQWAAVLREDRDWLTLLFEFWLHAARDPELRARLQETRDRNRAAMAGAARRMRERSGEAPGMSDDDIALAFVALGNGMALETILGGADAEDWKRLAARIELGLQR
jgi:AcrR family transcriptional regulator